MRKFTYLFCHLIVFAKFNMLTSFNLHFFANIEGAYTRKKYNVFQNHSVLPHKVWTGLILKVFHDRWGIIFGRRFTEGLFCMEG